MCCSRDIHLLHLHKFGFWTPPHSHSLHYQALVLYYDFFGAKPPPMRTLFMNLPLLCCVSFPGRARGNGRCCRRRPPLRSFPASGDRPTDRPTATATGGGLTDYDAAFLALMIRSISQSLIGSRWGESLSLCISTYLVPAWKIALEL